MPRRGFERGSPRDRARLVEHPLPFAGFLVSYVKPGVGLHSVSCEKRLPGCAKVDQCLLDAVSQIARILKIREFSTILEHGVRGRQIVAVGDRADLEE